MNKDISETVYYHALEASSELAAKEGLYETYSGSLVSKWESSWVYYLLGQWSRLVTYVPYLKGNSTNLLNEFVPKIMGHFISSKVDSIQEAAALPALADNSELLIVEAKLGAILNLRQLSGLSSEHEAELSAHVLRLINVIDCGLHSQTYGEVTKQRLDRAVLIFFQHFRKSYIGDQTMHSSKLVAYFAFLECTFAVDNLAKPAAPNLTPRVSDCPDVVPEVIRGKPPELLVALQEKKSFDFFKLFSSWRCNSCGKPITLSWLCCEIYPGGYVSSSIMSTILSQVFGGFIVTIRCDTFKRVTGVKEIVFCIDAHGASLINYRQRVELNCGHSLVLSPGASIVDGGVQWVPPRMGVGAVEKPHLLEKVGEVAGGGRHGGS
ncbi:hypothetical protein RHSIM_Rhsim09G0101900 [Rhododendron simsii]|uniref:Exportin-7/Ran-binding protein 17 TPR repeats domain-containing protein n=1 Tax=Rhododendron simsii TaxID=118357 RepID=A0A834GHV4_RHOSS|nr:hypothetical protein RHSIM_Rhsim09G0101900 [Rhododendron simsii]